MAGLKLAPFDLGIRREVGRVWKPTSQRRDVGHSCSGDLGVVGFGDA